MNKKTYITPDITIVNVNIEYHLCDPSTTNVDDNPLGPIAPDPGGEEEPTGAKGFELNEQP
ncbi:UNVERIFIED_CONTAM: hypothetical protein NY100_00040 [Prevotella sp. 15_C9]